VDAARHRGVGACVGVQDRRLPPVRRRPDHVELALEGVDARRNVALLNRDSELIESREQASIGVAAERPRSAPPPSGSRCA
jgi:hypothetical protein